MKSLSGNSKTSRMLLNYSISSILPALISMATTTIFTRTFSTEVFGLYSLVLAVANFIRMFLSQWIRQAVLRVLPESLDDPKKMAQLLRTYLTGIWIVVGTEVVMVSIAVVTSIRIFDVAMPGIILAAAVYVVTSSLFEMMNSLFAGEMRSGQFVRFKVSDSILTFTIRLFLVFGVFKLGGSALFLGIALSQILLLPLLWKSSRLPGFLPDFKDSNLGPELKSLFLYGYPMALWFLSSLLLSIGDRFVLKALMGDATVGIYNASYNLINGIMMLMATPINLTFHPLFMKAQRNHDTETVSFYLEKIIRYIITLGCALAGLALLFYRDAAKILLGAPFRSGAVIFPLVVIGMTFWTASLFVHKPLEFKKRTLTMSIVGMVSAGLNIGLNLLFIPHMGFIGAAVATVLSYLSYMLITMFLVRKIQPMKYRIAGYLKLALPVCGATGILFILRQTFDPEYTWRGFAAFIIPGLLVLVWVLASLYKEKKRDDQSSIHS